MKILYVIPYVPSLIRVRPYNLIRYMAKRGHQITLVTLWSDQDKEDLKSLRAICTELVALRISRWRSIFNSIKTLPTSKPLQSMYCWQPSVMRELTNLVQNEHFDAIHVEHLRGAEYALFLKRILEDQEGKRNIPIIWDSVDCISLLFRQSANQSRKLSSRMLTRFELRRTERYEANLIGMFERILITSPKDRDAYLSLNSSMDVENRRRQFSIVPNGVDLDYFSRDLAVVRAPATLVVTGKMSYHANVTMVLDIVEQIMPLVWQDRPDAKLQIVGKDPDNAIRRLATHPNIEVTDTVPDIRPYLRQATIAVAPLSYGVGIQNKVLEAMACGTPVVTTAQAMSALEAIPEQDLLVAEDNAVFAQKVVQLLSDPIKQKEVGESGFRYVTEKHDWNRVAALLENIYEECSLSQKQLDVS